MKYQKPYISTASQVDLLLSRGLVGDRDETISLISAMGYYRFTGYAYPYRKMLPNQTRSDYYVHGATVHQVAQLQEFDRQLRLIMLDGIERIELKLRYLVAMQLGASGPFSYLDTAVFSSEVSIKGHRSAATHKFCLKKILETSQRKDEDFIKHFNEKYEGEIPIWVATELLEFGPLCSLVGLMSDAAIVNVASGLGMVEPSAKKTRQSLNQWLRQIRILRNVCAHHGRLWNRNFASAYSTIQPPEEKWLSQITQLAPQARHRIVSSLLLCAKIVHHIRGDAEWHERLVRHIQDFPTDETVGIKQMGLPKNFDVILQPK